MSESVTRVELIDHRIQEGVVGGRVFVALGVSVSLSYQDSGRTLKVFVDNRKETRRASREADTAASRPSHPGVGPNAPDTTKANPSAEGGN